MEQRDYLLRQLELMTQAIVALIRKLTGLKDQGADEQLATATDEVFTKYFNTSLTDMNQVPVEEIVDFVVQDRKLHPKNIDLFAEVLLMNAANNTHADDRTKLLERALVLLEYSDKTGGIFSIERHRKIQDIRQMLEKM